MKDRRLIRINFFILAITAALTLTAMIIDVEQIGVAGVAIGGILAFVYFLTLSILISKAFGGATDDGIDPKTAGKLGIGIEALQEFRYAAERSGISTATFDSSLTAMQKRLGEAAQGTGAAKKALDQIGLSASDLIAMGPERAMGAIAHKLQGIEAPAERAADPDAQTFDGVDDPDQGGLPQTIALVLRTQPPAPPREREGE